MIASLVYMFFKTSKENYKEYVKNIKEYNLIVNRNNEIEKLNEISDNIETELLKTINIENDSYDVLVDKIMKQFAFILSKKQDIENLPDENFYDEVKEDRLTTIHICRKFTVYEFLIKFYPTIDDLKKIYYFGIETEAKIESIFNYKKI